MSVSICQHIHDAGRRCGSPAMQGEAFCYFHARMYRRPRRKHGPQQEGAAPVRIYFGAMESVEAVQIAVTHVMQALADELIDNRKANTLIRGLNLTLASLRLQLAEKKAENFPVRRSLRIPTYSQMQDFFSPAEEAVEVNQETVEPDETLKPGETVEPDETVEPGAFVGQDENVGPGALARSTDAQHRHVAQTFLSVPALPACAEECGHSCLCRRM